MKLGTAALPTIATPFGPAIFQNLLLFVTIVPYAAYVLSLHLMYQGTPISQLTTFLVIMNIIGTAHVPATVYLFTDKAIRQRARRHPFNMIIFPIVGIIAYPALIFTLWHMATSFSLTLMFSLVVLLIAWQAWHFGMQSYGAFSFVAITSGRPAPDAKQRIREKQCVIMGIIGGMLNVYAVISPAGFIKKMPMVDYAAIDAIGRACHVLGIAMCITASLYAIAHIIYHRRRFTISSAIMFFLGASFFLPDILPQFVPTGYEFNLNSANNFVMAHALQYIVFLAAHAAGQWHARSHHYSQSEKRILGIFAAMIPLITLLIVMEVGTAMMDMNATGWAAANTVLLFGIAIDPNKVFVGWVIIQGITVAHFLIDNQVWKLSKPQSREWILARYSHVLPVK